MNNTITIDVKLDEAKLPEAITFEANGQQTDCKAMLLGFFERESRDTLRIELWTKDMEVKEMDNFFYKSLQSMADTYFRATKNKELASAFQHFTQYFGETTEVIPKTK